MKGGRETMLFKMLSTLIFCWILSDASHGNPINPTTARPYALAQYQNFTLKPNPRFQVLQKQSTTPGHDHDDHQRPHGNHDSDGPKGHINKLEIQKFITQKDLEKQQSKDAAWKTYFAEILAATILVCAMVVFVCWWNLTRRERRRSGRSSHAGGPGTMHENRRFQRQQTFQRGRSMPELYVNINPAKVSKSSYVFSPDEKKPNKMGYNHDAFQSSSSII